MSDNIKVAIKVRPLITREKDENLSEQWIIQENSLKPKTYTSSNEIFYFDNVFDTTSSNSDVYNAVVAPITAAAVNGFNGTIFAYGQTSSGKTYTMTGAKQEYGIVQLVINDIFKLIANHSNREFLLRASFIEIYNEKINDLLDSDNSKKDGNKASINIYEEDGVVKLNVKEEISDTPTNLMDIMRRGEKNRVIGETNMNERSSRSHTIFRIIIESRDSNTNDPDGAIQVAHLNLVDLAGSERVSQTGAKGVRLREGAHINKSLFILSHVINQLSESTDATKYISFRDSKLTRILQSSLGGNAKTVIICAITPASLDETTSTLMFASRAKSIKNKPKVNEIVSNDTLLKRYAKQISILKDQLEREQKEKENNQEEYSLANRRLQERIFLLQKFMLRPQVTPIKQMLPTIGSLVPESIDKTIRRQTWCASAKSLFSLPKLPQGVLAEDLYVPLLRNKFNDMTLNNSSSFISGENFEFENVFNFDNSLLLKEGNLQHENESVPMEPFELELIASVKNKVNETLTTLPPLDVTTVNRKSEENECEIENLKTKLNYYKTEYETLKEFVGDENTILNVRIDELEKYNKEILIDNVKLQDLLNTKDSEIKSLNIKLSGYSSANPLLGSETIDTAITRLLRKKDEILEIKNDISKQIISYNVQDVDKNTDYLKRLHNEFTEVFKVLDMNSKVVHTMQRLNNHYKTTLQNIKLPRNKLGTIDEDEDCEEYLDTIQEIMEDTLRLRTHIHDMSAQIEYLQKHNHLLVSEYEKLRDEFSTKIKDQINDSKKLQNTIDILKSEKLDLEQKHIKSIEFIKQIEQEKEFWEELQRKNKTLKQQIDSLQETKNDFDQKLKNLEETYLTQIQETTNEFQVKVNSLETSNITLENEVKFLKENNQSLEINNKDIKNDYNEIKMLHSNFYQELQKLTNQFEKLILKTSFYDDGNISENSKESKLLAQYRNLIECTEKYLQNEDNIKYELENKISNLTSQISKFESKDDQKYCNSDNKEKEIQRLKEIEEEKNSLIKELKMKGLQIFELENQIESVKNVNITHDEILCQKEALIMKKKIEKLESSENLTRKEFEDLKEELNLKNFKISELEEEIQKIKHINVEQNDKSNDQQEIQNNSEASQSEFLKEELKMKNLKIFELEEEIEEIKQFNLEQNQDIVNHQKEIDVLIKKLESSELKTKDLAPKISLIKDLEENLSSTKEEIKLKDFKILELDKQIEEMKQINSEQIERIYNFQEENRSTKKELEELQLKNKELTEKSELLNELEDSVSVTKEELNLKDLKISELDKQIEDMKQINSEQIEQISNYQEEMRSTLKKLEELELKNKEFTEKSKLLNELESSISVTKEELKLKDLKISELDQQIEDMKQINSEQIERINNFHEENRSTIKELEELELKNKEFTEKSELLNELEDSVSITKEELKLKDLKISELDQQIEDMKQINSEQNECIYNYQEEICSKIREFEELQLKNKELTEKAVVINELENFISVTREELKLKNSKMLELKKQIEKMKQINLEQNERMRNYQEEISSTKGRLELDSLNEQLELKNLKILELEKQIQDNDQEKMNGMIKKLNESELKCKDLAQKIVLIKDLENSISSTKKELKFKDLKIFELEKQITEMKQVNLEQNRGMSNCQEEIRCTIEKLEELQFKNKEIAEKSTMIKELEDSLNSTKEEIKLKELKIMELENQLEEIKQVNLVQNDRINTYQEAIQNTMVKLEELELKDQILTEKSAVIKDLENKVNLITQELNSKNLIISELENQIDEIKQINLEQNRRIINYNETDEEKMQYLKNKFEEINIKYNNLQENYLKLETEKKTLQDQISSVISDQNKNVTEIEKKYKDSEENYKSKIQKLMKEKEQLANNYMILKKNYKDARCEVLLINAKLTTLENQYKEKETAWEQSELKIKQLEMEQQNEQEIKNLKEIIKNSNDRKDYLEKKLLKKHESNQSIKQELESKKKMITNLEKLNTELEKNLTSKNIIIQNLEQKLNEDNESLKQELETKHNIILSLESTIKKLENLNHEIKENHISQEETIRNLNQNIETLEQKNYNFEKNSKSLKQDLESKNNIISKLESKIVELKKLNQEQKDNLMLSQTTLEKVTIDFENNIKSLKQDLGSKNIISKLESKIVELEKLNQEQKDNLILSQTTLEKMTVGFENNIKSLKQDFESKNIAISKLETKIVELETLNQEQKENLNSSQTTLEKVTIDFENNIKSLKKALEAKNITISKLETTIVELEKSNQEQKENLISSQTTLEKVKINFENNIKSLNEELQSKCIAILNLESKILDLEKIKQKQKDNLNSQTTLEINTIDFENNIKLLKQELESKNMIISNLETKIYNLEKSEKRNLDQIQQCSKEIEISNRITLEETVDKMKKRIRDLQRKLMDADQEKKLLKNRLERQVQQNDELAETFNIQLSTEAEFLEKEIEQKNDAIKKLENDKGELIGQLQNLKNQIGLKDKTLENLNKDLNIKEKLIIDLNNKLLPLKNHNSPLKENYNKYEFDYKMEIQKLTKEKNRFMQISQMNSKELKKIHQKLKDKEESEIKLKLLLEEIKEENTILVKKNNELIQNEENRCENCSKMNDNNIQTINLNKQLELELMSLKTENEMNIEKIHQLEDKISELRSSDHRSTTPTPNTGRKNRLSTSKRNELFDEARRNRMENELNSAQQCLTDNSSNTISMPPILKCDRSIQVDIFELGYGHGSGIVTEYHYDKKLREITKKKEFYKELAVLRKTNLKKLEDRLCDTCRRNK